VVPGARALTWHHVASARGKFHHACAVADRWLGSHVRRWWFGYLIVSVFLDHIFQTLSRPFIIEVDINIRQWNTVRIEETLKEQIISNRINIRDPDAKRNSRTAAARDPGLHSHPFRELSKWNLVQSKVARIACFLSFPIRSQAALFFLSYFRVSLLEPS